jgi:LPPG:FO 2-phospho-L-lactate transferase
VIVALAGGVGGAKLAQGLLSCAPPGQLAVVVNTADDFDLHGLRICPDLDTVMYTLAGIANPHTGWGVEGDTWSALDMLGRYGGETWFRIGDRDLATHVLRTQQLLSGRRLTEVTAHLASALGAGAALLPMCDENVATLVETPEGVLEFQEYFVRLRHAPEVLSVRFQGVEAAAPTPEVLRALEAAELVVFCPSNPVVSIGPILATPGMRDALRATRAPKVAVSPIVAGRALRGPADRMLSTLGHEVSALGVARMYGDVVQGLVLDDSDAELCDDIERLGIRTHCTDAVMERMEDRARLARETLAFGQSLAREGAALS